MRKFWKPFFIVGCLILLSCVKDIDFDQAGDVTLAPVFELDFIFADIDTNELTDTPINPGTTIPNIVVRDTINYDLLGDFTIDNLERIELLFEFSNTIPRDFTFTLGFLNDAEQRIGPTYNFTARMGNGPNEGPVITIETINLDVTLINALSATQKLVTAVEVQNVNLGLEGSIALRSKGSYFINYDL